MNGRGSGRIVLFAVASVGLVVGALFVTSTPVVAWHGGNHTDEGTDTLPPSFERGEYTIIVPDICNRDFYTTVDVEPGQGEDTWVLVCAPHDDYDQQETIGVFWADDLERAIQEKEEELGESESMATEAGPEAEEGGGFFGWVKDTISGVKTVFSGEVTHSGKQITCSEEREVKKIRGGIVSVEGEAYVNRGLQSLKATEGMELLGGDVVTVQESATVTADFFESGELTITEMTKFQVPKKEFECRRNTVGQNIRYTIGGAWLQMKNKLSGEKFEIWGDDRLASGRRG